MHFRGYVDDILWRAIKSKHLMYFSSMPNKYDSIQKYFEIATGEPKMLFAHLHTRVSRVR